MVKSMPESSYELSLKDLVEHPRVEVAQEKGAEERKNLGDKNVDSRKKVDMNIKKGQVKRSGNIDSGGATHAIFHRVLCLECIVRWSSLVIYI